MLPSTSALLAAAFALIASTAALAAPKVEIGISQAKEVVEQRGEKRESRFVPAKEVTAGDVVEYTLAYKNAGDQPARDAVIDDPIPKGTSYLAASATGEGAEITFSTDGGKTFAPAVRLTYQLRLPSGQVETRSATPSDYTHVRWTVREIAPGATGTVSFRVRVN